MVHTPEYRPHSQEIQGSSEAPVESSLKKIMNVATAGVRSVLGLPPKKEKKVEKKEEPVATKEFDMMEFGHVSGKPLGGAEWEVTFSGRGIGSGTIKVDQKTFTQWRYILENMHRVFKIRALVNNYTQNEVVSYVQGCEKKMGGFKDLVKYLAKPQGHERGNPDVIHAGKPGDLFVHDMDTIGKDFWANSSNFEKLADYERMVGSVWDERSMWHQKKAS